MKKREVGLALLSAVVLAIAGLQAIGLVNAMPSYFPNNPKTLIVPDDYSTILEAISNAVDGDTVYVRKGVYVENPVVNKSILLVGEDRDSTVIDVTAGLKVTANGVTVTGFTIYDGWQGISVSGNGCRISGNTITNATHGIVVVGYENNITGNILRSIGLSSAIQLNFANRNLINRNYIESCVEGIQIWQNSNNNTITENTITNCKDTAINFQYSNDNMVIGNNISRSGLGTSIYGSNRNTISNNNYISNVVQFGAGEWYYLTFGHNRSINTINGNYWSDYHGTDANRDGVGDTPYIIGENVKDDHPLMSQVKMSISILPGIYDFDTLPIVSFPNVSILSPGNTSYAAIGNSYTTVPLTFEANASLSWVGYSLDGGANVTVSNGTMIEIPVGSSNLTVYANDTVGNWAVPQTVYYSVAWNGGTPPEPFPWLPIAVALTVAVAAVVAVAAAVYLKKRRR